MKDDKSTQISCKIMLVNPVNLGHLVSYNNNTWDFSAVDLSVSSSVFICVKEGTRRAGKWSLQHPSASFILRSSVIG